MVKLKAKISFDPKPILRAAEKAQREANSKGADLVRDRARGSMPAKPGLAAPGDPPRMESRWLLRSIRSGFDRGTQTGVAGPLRFGGAGAGEERQLFRVLEKGGSYKLGKKAKRRRKIGGKDDVVVRVPAKPYMQPALLATLPKLPGLWRDSIVK